MRSRLFWKILLAFLLALIVILQGVWLAFALMYGERATHEREMALAIAPYQISAARLAVEAGGEQGLRRLAASWPAPASARGGKQIDWTRVRLVAPGSEQPGNPGERLLASATDPAGRSWTLVYTLPAHSTYAIWSVESVFGFYRSPHWAVPGVIGSIGVSACLAWYLSRPARVLRTGFRQLAAGRLDTRVQAAMGRRRDELADLARDFDTMAEKLEYLVGARDQLLHDVSHELRSPLARLNLAAALARQEHGQDEAFDRIALEVGRLDSLVGSLLSLSRHESGEAAQSLYVDVAALVAAVASDASFEARLKGVTVATSQGAGRVTVEGSAELAYRALDNIVRNAMSVSDAGGRIDIVTAVLDGTVCIDVLDRGPGVAQEDIARMLAPYVRLTGKRMRRGFGLGLSIASRAVASQGGTIAIANRPGGGLSVRIILPLADTGAELVS